MLEHEVQKRFISYVTGESEISGGEENRLHLYRDLVNYRFREVLQNTFPRFAQKIGKELFQKVVEQFILTKPSTPYIWQMPDEFRHFVVAGNMSENFPFVEDLLWYEWIEVELFMKNYRLAKTVPFDWKGSWGLFESANLREMAYCVFQAEYEISGHYPVILYYNFLDNEVHFQEITPFLVRFFQYCQQLSVIDALQAVANEFKLDVDDVQSILTPTLEDFAAKKVIVQSI